jgi:hypothetical protein
MKSSVEASMLKFLVPVLAVLSIVFSSGPIFGQTPRCAQILRENAKVFGVELDLTQWIISALNNHQKTNVETPTANSLVVGIPAEDFIRKVDPEGRGRQECSMWCWAASTQMVMDYYNIDRPQDRIVSEFGVNSDGAGTVDAVLKANSGIYKTRDGRTMKVTAALIQDQQEIIEELKNGRPLIIGINNKLIPSGHEYVLTAVEYTENQGPSSAKAKTLILRNPMPGRPSRMEFDVLTEGNRVDHVIRIQVTPYEN